MHAVSASREMRSLYRLRVSDYNFANHIENFHASKYSFPRGRGKIGASVLRLMRLRASVAALCIVCTATCAQDVRQVSSSFPARPIRILVGQAPGGGVDSLARAFAQRMAQQVGQSVVVDNRAGAAGMIAAKLVAQSAPDGYTLLIVSTGTLIASMLLKKIDYNVEKAYDPIASLSSQPYLLVVGPQLPVRSVKELISYAKAKPNAINYASTGIGSASHLGTELFDSIAGIEMVHIAYKGVSQALVDLLSGQVQVAFATVPSVAPHVNSGKVRALAVSALKRIKAFPDLPTVNESGLPGFELAVEYGMLAPARTPAPVIDALNKWAGQIMHNPEIADRLALEGAEVPVLHSAAQFRAKVHGEVAKWDHFFKTSKIDFK
jgi:tripartite-type tricarboxylate transporter receptor subunit TctC